MKVRALEWEDGWSGEFEVVPGERLRHLPGRRSVYRASAKGVDVLLKHFTHGRKAESDARREWLMQRELRRRGVPTPRELFLGRAEEGFVLATEFLAEARPFVEDSPQDFAALLRLIQRCHEAGFLQRDLHLGNVLVRDHEMWMLDPTGGEFADAPLSLAKQARNFALLAANVDLPKHERFWAAWQTVITDAALTRKARALTPKAILTRARNFVAKTQRTCSAFVREDLPGGVVLRVRDCLPEIMAKVLAFPFDQETQRAVSIDKVHTLTSYPERDGRARRAWIAGQTLRHFGLVTPEPIACVERKGAPDVLLCRAEECRPPASLESGKRIQELETLLAALRQLHASLGDISAACLQVASDGRVSIGDLSRARLLLPGWLANRAARRDRERLIVIAASG